MMAALQNDTEYEKGTKKTFAPPTQKSHSVIQLNSWKEDTLGTSSLEAEAKPSRPKAISKKERKKATEQGPGGGQENKSSEKKGKRSAYLPTSQCFLFPEDEKMETIQDGRECSLEDKQKTVSQDHSQIRGQKEEEGGFGQCLIWVQCSFPKCEKWRQLRGDIDPSVLPDNWSCDQNPDLNYNRCDIPEETWTGCESDVAYASYIPGSIIWAKQHGYPWWPGMIEPDPDLGEYFLFASHLDSLPKKCRNKDYSQKLEAAITMAHEAEQINIQERVNLFGFLSRYNGPGSTGEGTDLALCESNSPESCLEKEKDSEEKKEEKEEKKNPTLPRPKPATIQTKKTKSRGLAGGRDGTPKEKTVKKSPGNGPTLGGKEEQGNSDLDHPGPKKKFKTPESKASAINLPEENEIKIVSECSTPPAQLGVCPLGKEGPGPQEPLTQGAASFPPEDDGSSDLDLEQLMEDIGEPEERGDSQHRDGSEEFLAALFEE
ncbi:hypothetical protein ACRRTK_008480 [Alexandromys fortis]